MLRKLLSRVIVAVAVCAGGAAAAQTHYPDVHFRGLTADALPVFAACDGMLLPQGTSPSICAPLGAGVVTALGKAPNAPGGFVTAPVANEGIEHPAVAVSGRTVELGGHVELQTQNVGRRQATQNIDNTQFNTATYDAFPTIKALPDGSLLMCYFSGAHHPGAGAGGVGKCRSSTNGGANWSAPTTVVSDAGYDDRFGVTAVTPTGRIILFWPKYTDDTASFVGSFYKYSDDQGQTWSSTIALPAAGVPYGDAIAIGDGKLMISTYSGYTTGVAFSTDNGATWSARTTAIGPDATNYYTEGSFAYLGGGRIVGLVRKNGGTTYFRQVYSQDNGETWTDQGDASFPASSTRGPARLDVVNGLDGNLVVRALYQDRDAKLLRVRLAPASALTAGPGAWKAATDVAIGSLTTNLSGYPDMLPDCLTCFSGIVAYYDETAAPSDADIFLMRMPAQPYASPPLFVALGVSATAPDGALMAGACDGHGAAQFGAYGSAGVLTVGVASGGVVSIQSCTSTTNAARDLALQQYGGKIAVGKSAATQTVDVNGSVGATSFYVGGVAGFTGTKTAGACTLHYAGGLLTSVDGC